MAGNESTIGRRYGYGTSTKVSVPSYMAKSLGDKNWDSFISDITKPKPTSFTAPVGKPTIKPKSVAPKKSTAMAPLKAPPALVPQSSNAVAQTTSAPSLESALALEAGVNSPQYNILGTGSAMSGLAVGSDASNLSQLGSYMPQDASLPTAFSGNQSAPWYSTNAGGFSDEYLASLSPTDRVAAQGLSSNFSNVLGNIGQGVSAIGGIYDMYSQYQQNKLMKDAYNMQKSEYNRQVAKDRDFATNINASGLGKMSVR